MSRPAVHPDPATEERIQRLLTLRAVIESCRRQLDVYTNLKLEQKIPSLQKELKEYQQLYEQGRMLLLPADLPYLDRR